MRNSLGLGGPQRDLLCNGTSGFLFWCLPWFTFALGWVVSPIWRTLLWTASLGVMGILCLLNASRCGRVHCYFTGPFFILGAVASLGYGLGFLPFGPSGWKWICAIAVVGGIALTCIPELILGRYRRNPPEGVSPIDEANGPRLNDRDDVCHEPRPWLISFSLGRTEESGGGWHG